MKIFFTFKWLLFPFPGLEVEEVTVAWEALAFIATFCLLIAFKAALIFPATNFMGRICSLIPRFINRKKQREVEVEELKYLRAQKIFFETGKLISGGSAVKKNDPAVHYNLARAYSLFNKPKEALFHLHKATESDYVSLAKVQNDKDLASLRLSQEFKKFIKGKSLED